MTRLDEPIQTFEGAWIPEDEHSTAPAMTVRAALRTSSNRAAVRMLEQVGIEKTVDQARKMGLGNVPSVPSIALGSGEVTLMAMTSAYAAFADEGQLRSATFIRRVEDADGAVLYQARPSVKEVVSPKTAFLMTSMLSDVINYGTANRARQEGFTLPAAGKTGTTNDYVDAWFVGFTPHLVTGVWVGFDKPRTIIANGFAGELAVPMWARYMKQATAQDKAEAFKAPQGLTAVSVCRETGKLPGALCERVITDYFVRGTAPTEVCLEHGFYQIAASGQLAATSTSGIAGSSDQPREAVQTLEIANPALSESAARTDAAAGTTEEPKKKKGFWGRIFGRSGDDKGKNDDKKEAKKGND